MTRNAEFADFTDFTREVGLMLMQSSHTRPLKRGRVKSASRLETLLGAWLVCRDVCLP